MDSLRWSVSEILLVDVASSVTMPEHVFGVGAGVGAEVGAAVEQALAKASVRLWERE